MELDTELFGTVDVHTEDGRVEVRGGEVPPVDLVNTGTRRTPWIPVGTRTAAELALTVDGRRCDLRPGPGKYRRGSYRVLAQTPGGPLLLTPNSAGSSRLVRGERWRPDQEFGVLTRFPDGTVLAEWREDSTVAGVTSVALRPEPVEVAVGFALALGFGTGAHLFFGGLLAAFDRMLPG